MNWPIRGGLMNLCRETLEICLYKISIGRDTWWIRICEREFRSFKKIYNGARSFE